MQVFAVLLLALQLAAAHAVPLSSRGNNGRTRTGAGRASQTSACSAPASGVAEGEGEGEGNEVEQQGTFGTPIALVGGDVKQDTLFPPGTNGVFEVEFQNPEGRTLTVTENKAPAAPPTGFVALEPVSYIIDLAEGADNLTLSKVDWILSEGKALDISNGQIGRFCSEAGAFVIDPAVGELEFEAEENELTLTVTNINGEWGIFLPSNGSSNGSSSGSSSGSSRRKGF